MSGHPIFARFYDRILSAAEEGGLAEMREQLVRTASGRTLELGAGTGHNLGHYTDAVSELVLTEPDPHMASRLREHVAAEPPKPGKVEVSEAPAEELPFDDGSFDTVVATLVLCTVDDPRKSLAEIKRLLAPDGRLLYIEHVRADSRGMARAQDIFDRPWGWFAGGCHPNRPTGDSLAEAGLQIERLDRGEFPKAPGLVKPLISGVARRP